MSKTARILRVFGAALCVVSIGLLAWWFLIGREAASSGSAQDAVATAVQATTEAPAPPVPTPTLEPSPTPSPTPTPTPTPVPFVDVVPLEELAGTLISPLPECGLVPNAEVVAGTITLTCLEDWASAPVVAAANGRIVHVVREEAVVAVPERNVGPGVWAWSEQAELGPHVVIDHGPLGDSTNTQTVYAGLSLIDDTVRVGVEIGAGEPLGQVAGPAASLRFSVWRNNERQDGAIVVGPAPGADQQRAVAAALAPILSTPTDPRCPLVRSAGQLPGAARDYRNGTHQGIDFGCGAADRSAFAIADGTVVFLVDDYLDPSVPEREALLAQAGRAGFTPHWTLVMLYGNVVVIDHGQIPGAGRMVTIAAHLEEVDPAITLGATVTGGQRLGELGNRGTNASALGIRGAADPSLHLHWELFIDNWYLGSGLNPVTTSEVIATALCGAAQTPGC